MTVADTMVDNMAAEQRSAERLATSPFRRDGFVRDGCIAVRGGESLPMQALPAFLRALLVTDGTVTKILEAYFWEPVIVDTLNQEFTLATAAIPWIRLAAGDRVLRRQARLRGGDSGQCYARALSLIRAEQIPPGFRERLIAREIGIGALIRDSGLESYRELLDVGIDGADPAAEQSAGADWLFRTYRIIIGSEPVILITESFPLALYR